MKITRTLTLIGSLLAMLTACTTASPSGSVVPERDIKAAAAKFRNATILDIDLFQPITTIGERCEPRPLASRTVSKEKLSKALAEAQSYSVAQKGVGLIVVHDGEIIHESYIDGVTAKTPTDSFSMHKSLLALILGVAIDEKIIGSLNDPVEKYIDEWKNDPRGKITIKQLLNMESGLQLYSFTDPDGKSMALLLSADINAVAMEHPLFDRPGAEFRYNNVNSQILGIVLERALKRKGSGSYADYLEQKLWCAVGNDTAKLWLDREGGTPHYYSGLFTNPHNWARIGELVRNGGQADGQQILSTKWLRKMRQAAPTNPNYGLHIWIGSPHVDKRRYSKQNPLSVIHSEAYRAKDVVFFDGFGGQRVYIIPSQKITIVRTGQVNMAYDDSTIVNLVLDGLVD